MRHTEFWARLDRALGTVRARTWAELFVLTELGGRTTIEALDDGVAPRQVWAAVWRVLELAEGIEDLPAAFRRDRRPRVVHGDHDALGQGARPRAGS